MLLIYKNSHIKKLINTYIPTKSFCHKKCSIRVYGYFVKNLMKLSVAVFFLKLIFECYACKVSLMRFHNEEFMITMLSQSETYSELCQISDGVFYENS